MRALSLRRRIAFLAASGGLLWSTGCGSDVLGPGAVPDAGTVTVDAAAAAAYLKLDGDTLRPVTIGDPTTSTGWDLSLFATTVGTNGGAAGPGGVEVACICANQVATNGEVAVMTAASELADFDAVTAASAASATFASDVLAPAIAGWYTGSGAGATVTAGRSWLIREGSPTAVLAKFRVLSIAPAGSESMGLATIEFAVQPAAGQPFGATQQVAIAVGTSPVYFDLTTGAVTTAANWDLQLAGWTIRVNGGVSGSGTVRALLDTATPFAGIDATYAASPPPQAFSADAFSGTFSGYRWYRYNITGVDNQIWPTFNVYLVRRGAALYKVQLIDYYGPAGEPRQITIRYQRLVS